jgi:2-polyprenyl-6-methoxyphenol hydroxylase-like FAD-dependent oxidoreductase
MTTYDAIIVGARCAGSPTAMLLARKGYRVLLVDRATFPSDSMRGHFIRYAGVSCLQRWGLMERVLASNCPPVRSHTVHLGDFALTGSPAMEPGIAGELAPRRRVLDRILVEAAVEAGVELYEGCTVQDLLTDGDRITGIGARTKGGRTMRAAARIVVGADGLYSAVARAVRAPTYHVMPKLTCSYFSFWSGLPQRGLEVQVRGRLLLVSFPTNDDLVCVGAQWPVEQFSAIRTDVEASFHKSLDRAPELAERVRRGRREEHFRGTGDLPNFFRKPYGPGWALVGDAGYHKDPFSATGISDAFRDAELLVEALDAGFCRRQPLDEALARYEEARTRAALPQYQETCRQASFVPPPPHVLQLRAALRSNQAATDQFYGVALGTVPAAAFYAADNMQRIMTSAAYQ